MRFLQSLIVSTLLIHTWQNRYPIAEVDFPIQIGPEWNSTKTDMCERNAPNLIGALKLDLIAPPTYQCISEDGSVVTPSRKVVRVNETVSSYTSAPEN